MQIIRSRAQYDVCIIGSGAGGGMAAKVLTEAGANVVVGDLREDAVRPLREEWGEQRVAVVVGDVREEATGAPGRGADPDQYTSNPVDIWRGTSACIELVRPSPVATVFAIGGVSIGGWLSNVIVALAPMTVPVALSSDGTTV